MSKELRDEYRRLHGDPHPKKTTVIIVCLCAGGNSIRCVDENCLCPFHYATWKEYQHVAPWKEYPDEKTDV